jgi:hypothetical protein
MSCYNAWSAILPRRGLGRIQMQRDAKGGGAQSSWGPWPKRLTTVPGERERERSSRICQRSRCQGGRRDCSPKRIPGHDLQPVSPTHDQFQQAKPTIPLPCLRPLGGRCLARANISRGTDNSTANAQRRYPPHLRYEKGSAGSCIMATITGSM